MPAFAGIDPGMDGFVAVLRGDDEPELLEVPTLPTGAGAKRLYDERALWQIVVALKGCDLVLLEQQQPMPKQGVSSTFSIGYGYGLWVMALTAAGVPWSAIRPAAWKKAMRISAAKGKDANARRKQAKALAIQRAQALFPDVSLMRTERSRTPSADMAEALLLASYARAGAVLTGRA